MPGTAGETDGEKLARLGTDATLWARELAMALFNNGEGDETGPIDSEGGSLLHVWLCNAIEAGRAAGYSAGRQEATAAAAMLASDLEADGDPVRADVAEDIRDRLTGWPIGELPANLAASGLPADSAASELPENLAGSEGARLPDATVAHLERIAESLERLAACVHPSFAAFRTVAGA